MSVALPQNQADMEALTRLLTRGYNQLVAQPEIWEVIPNDVRVCPDTDEISLQISGRNLWQGTEVFLNGRRHSQLLLLPDMGGVHATFKLEGLPQIDDDPERNKAEIAVWTRDWYDQSSIKLGVAKPGSQFCADASVSKPSRKLPPFFVESQWFKTGQRVILRFVDPKALSSYSSLDVYVQPISAITNAALAGRAKVAHNPPANPQNGKIEVALNDAKVHKLSVNGSGALFTVELTDSPNSKPMTQVATSLPIFYTQSGDSFAIESAGTITIAGLDSEIDIAVSGPPSPHVRYPSFEAPPQIPSSESLKLEASIVLPDDVTPTALNRIGSWSFGGSEDAPKYTMKLGLPDNLNEDKKSKLTNALKKGVDVTLKLTTPEDPDDAGRRLEINGSIKIKTP